MARTPFAFPEREPWQRAAGAGRSSVRAAGDQVGLLSLDDPELADFLRGGAPTASGAVVGIEGALKVATAWRCLHLIAGVCGNLPIDLYRRVGERQREPATNHPARDIVTRRPNGWQTSAEFRKLLTAHAVMKGNGYGLKITSRGRLLAIWPMHPDRVDVRQRPDMSLAYLYTRLDGSQIELTSADVVHLRGLSWDGIKGVGVLRYAREAMGLSLQAERAGGALFRHGKIGGKVFSMPGTLGDEAFDRLREQLDEVQGGAENAHKALILEDGLKSDGELMTAEDMQFLELREFQRSDVAMFFGVPPHMAGIVDKTTSWGSGIAQQSTGFVQYTADDWFVMWEQGLARDTLDPAGDRDLYWRINRNGLLAGDVTSRWNAYTRALQWGVYSPNEVRAFEDESSREGGDVYYDPPNTPGDQGKDEVTDEPPPRP